MVGYWIGLVGFVFEAFFERNAAGMLASVMVGAGVDVGRTTVSLVRLLGDERKSMARQFQEELDKSEHEHKDSSPT